VYVERRTPVVYSLEARSGIYKDIGTVAHRLDARDHGADTPAVWTPSL
jgi:hypothetical protein